MLDLALHVITLGGDLLLCGDQRSGWPRVNRAAARLAIWACERKRGLGLRKAPVPDRGHYQPLQRDNRPQAGIDGAMFRPCLGAIPAREDHRAAAAASLTARLLRSCEADLRRAQPVYQQEVRRGRLKRNKPAVEKKRTTSQARSSRCSCIVVIILHAAGLQISGGGSGLTEQCTTELPERARPNSAPKLTLSKC